MGQQIKEYSEEINLYYLWTIIVKRRKLIIGLFLVVVILMGVISSLMPKIYRGEAVISIWQNEAVSISTMMAKDVIPSKEIISPGEIAEIIGNVDNEKRMKILPKTHASVTGLKLKALKESKDKFIIIIDSRNGDDIPKALSEVLDYINNIGIVKLRVKEEREKLLNRLTELSEIVRSSSDLSDTYHKLLKAGKLLPVGFNPVDLNKKIADIKLEKLIVEQTLQRIQDGSLTTTSQLYVSNDPVKPRKMMSIIAAGVASLFIGIFLTLFLEYLEKIKSGSNA